MSEPAPDPAADPAPDPAADPAADPAPDVEAADQVEPSFPPKPFLRTGYDRHAVDAFTTVVVLAIHEARQTSVTADDVARVRFPARRFGPGYRMREVDDYLGAAEALLRMRATASGRDPRPGRPDGEPAPEVPQHEHHPTWWIYGVALLLVVVIVVFTMTQT